MGRRRAWLLLQCVLAGARPSGRRLLLCSGLSLAVISFRTFSRGLAGFTRLGRSEGNTGAAGLAQTYGDRLLGRTCAVLPFPYVFDLFVDEFSRRGGRRLPFFEILFCPSDYFLFRHIVSSLPS